MRHRVLAAALCMAVPAVRAVEVAPLREEIGTETYDIRGNTPQLLAAAIREDGPMAPWGQRVAGYTTADIHWWLRMVPEGKSCRLANANVRLTVTVTSPRWVDAVTGSVSLRRRWPAFLGALAAHEAVHLQLMRESAERVRAALAEVPPAATCAALEAAADEAALREVRAGGGAIASSTHARATAVPRASTSAADAPAKTAAEAAVVFRHQQRRQAAARVPCACTSAA